MKELTKGQQAPTTIIPGSVPDFPIAVVTENAVSSRTVTSNANRVSSNEQTNRQQTGSVSASVPSNDPKDLGDKYFYGNGVERDCLAAEIWYRQGAEQGDAHSQNKLGEMYGASNPYGCHIRTDYAEALRWFRQSAAQGFADAQFNMGVMYQYGYGVRMNLMEAVRWYRLSAAQGNTAAKVIVEQWDKMN